MLKRHAPLLRAVFASLDCLHTSVGSFVGSSARPRQAVAKPQVENIMNGFNGCCFAYGQTGSGERVGLSEFSSSALTLTPNPGTASGHMISAGGITNHLAAYASVQ